MSLFRDLMWFFKQEKKSYLLGISILIIVALLNLLPAYIIRIFVDGISAGTLSRDAILLWSAVLVVNGAITYALRYAWRVTLFGAAIRLSRMLRDQLFTHLTRLSPRFYHQHRTGDLMAHATNDIQAVESTAGEGVLTLVDSLTTGGLVILSMALFVDWKLTLITLLPMPLMAWSTQHYGNLLHERFGKAQAAFSDLNDKVQENVSAVRIIKAFGQEETEKADLRHLSDQVVEKNVQVAKVDALFDPTIMLIVGLCYFLAVAAGPYFVIKDRITLGQLTQFTTYLGQFIWPMLAFGWLFNITERGRASYDRIQALLKIQPDIKDSEQAITRRPEGAIEYALESFTYPGQEKPALTDIHLKLGKGQTLGIAGKTGSGKTTLLRVLLREFDYHDGQIKIDGLPIQSYRLASLRGAIGYVPQDHFLFSATVAENIAFGKPEASMEEIMAVACLACIHDDIERFPDQYATVVGDRGVTLSGGQKQRIAIARALLTNPEILILDDSLSAVDGKTEKRILEALKEQRKGRTTLISTHRLSAIEHADTIVVLKDGKISEQGTHERLIEQDGWYAATYASQQLASQIEGGAY